MQTFSCLCTRSSLPRRSERPTILLGVTHPQTCLVLGARLRVLRQSGFRVLLVSAPGDLLCQTAAQELVEHIPVPMQRGIAPFSDVISFLRLWKLIGRLRPHLVEFSTPKAGLLGTLAARLHRVPGRVYMLRGLKLERTAGFKRVLLLATERLAAACAHSVLCNSESLRAEALALRIAPAEKLSVLGHGSSNGVDTIRFAPGPSMLRERLGIAPKATVIGFVGRLTRDKGVPELIEAFEAMLRTAPSLRLLLVGWFDEAEDALGRELRARILSHPAIACTGFVPDTAPYYRAMDMLVLPTWREGFPNAVLEAAASAIPVIATISTGARDSVIPEVTGFLIPPGYPEAISEAVLKLVRDPERRLRMGRAARAWVLENYSEDNVLKLTADYYCRILNSAPVPARLANAPGFRKANPQPVSPSPPNR